MSRAFIGDRKSPTAGSGDLTALIAAKGDGAGPGYHHNSGLIRKRGFPSNDHVADHFDFSTYQFGDGGVNQIADLWTSGAGDANASPLNFFGINFGSGTCLANGGSKDLARLRLAHANRVTTCGSCRAKDGSFVTDQAGCPGSTPIDAEEECHLASCSTR
jgi:hypothetical protein